jgi:hypothetical protein
MTRTIAKTPSVIPQYNRILFTIFPYGNLHFPTLGNLHFNPIQIPFTLTINAIGTAMVFTAAGNARFGIYRDNGNMPDGGELVAECGPQATALGKTEIPLATPVQLTKGLYWLVSTNDDVTYRSYGPDIRWNVNGTLVGRSCALVFGALPNPCPATIAEANSPYMYVMVSSVP